MASFVKDALDPTLSLGDFYHRNIASIPQGLGLMAHAVISGHPEYAAGQIIPAMVSGEAGGAAGDVADAAKGAVGPLKDAVGQALRKPTGTLKPAVREGARLVGAGAGGSIAGGTGAVAGALAGPSIADLLIPEHPNPIGWSAKIPTRMPKQAPVPTPEPPQPFSGTTAPIFSGTTSSISQAGTTPPVLAPPGMGNAAVPAIKFVSKFETPEESNIVQPGSSPPNVKVTYQSVPQAELKAKVMTGDRNAILEWQRRGLKLPDNVGFMVEGEASPLAWRNYNK